MRKLRAALGLVSGLGILVATGKPVAAQVSDRVNYLFLMAQEMEQASGLEGQPIRLDAEGWYGGDYTRLWMKVEGDAATTSSEGEVEVQALFSRLVAPYWDLQAGIRVDQLWGDANRSRTHLALGVQGLAPYWFEVEATVFLSTEGDVSTQFTGSYDLLLTQRLVLESQLDFNAGLQKVAKFGEGSGITDLEVAMRLRYEIRREFAPYIGLAWTKMFSGTADYARLSGRRVRDGTLVAGLRWWY